jgi:hypothetical protein
LEILDINDLSNKELTKKIFEDGEDVLLMSEAIKKGT